jgi:hypothetical protein
VTGSQREKGLSVEWRAKTRVTDEVIPVPNGGELWELVGQKECKPSAWQELLEAAQIHLCIDAAVFPRQRDDQNLGQVLTSRTWHVA